MVARTSGLTPNYQLTTGLNEALRPRLRRSQAANPPRSGGFFRVCGFVSAAPDVPSQNIFSISALN